MSFDAVMSMAVHVEDAETLRERVPFDARPPRLDSRWQAAQAREFLDQARDFVKVTQFAQFVQAHQALYDAAGERLTKKLNERDYIGWFDKFFGARPRAKFFAMVGLLNGGHNYGVGIRFPEGREEISPVLGVAEFDDDGLPVFGEDIVPLVVHELCHSYTNPLVDNCADKLEAAGTRIYGHCGETMRQQAYGTWQTMLHESLVRACVVRYFAATEGDAAAGQAIQRHHERGFKWVGALVEVLVEYESNRAQYASFDAFMPRVVAFFDKYADEYDAEMRRAPKVVSMIPANRAADVDPALPAIQITFDRPMEDGSWSLVGGGPDFPKITGEIHYDASGRVLTVPVKLEPGHRYRFWLNSTRYLSFRSKAGVPLSPVAVSFKTRAE